MRKCVCLLLVLTLIFTFPLIANASSVINNSTYSVDTSYHEIVYAPLTKVETFDPRSEGPFVEYASDDNVMTASELRSTAKNNQFSPVSTNPVEIVPYASFTLDFDDAVPGVVILADGEIEITSGETATLNIQRCVWAPNDCSIRIGFWNARTAVLYYYTFYNGDIDGSYSFSNLPTGTYAVFVENRGPGNLTTGYMRFTIS